MLPTKGPDSYGYGAYTYGATHPEDASPKKRKRAKTPA